MKFFRTIKVALRALARNKMRSFLTALGIIIGVGAVIAMVSIGQGAKAEVEARFTSMGTNLLFVRSGSRSFRGVHGGSNTSQNLTPQDAEAIKAAEAVKYVSPSVNTRTQVVYGNKNWNTSVYGVGDTYPMVRNWEMDLGEFFTEQQVRAGSKVAVLGGSVSQNLFEGADPLGQIIRVAKIPFRVIGVMKSKGESGGFFNQDDMIVVPYTTAQRRLIGRTDRVSSIDVAAVSGDRTMEAVGQIAEIMRIRHKLAPGADDDFSITDMSEVAEGAAESTKILTILLGGIASISLLVGGIGIMNIMLVSVTERIREIGIRMSVGGRERDILLQFLTEAVTLSILGGLLGIAVGMGGSALISRFSAMNTVVSLNSIILAFVFSGSVGIFFGFYPARKASTLDPIEALRYE
ncbi:ABC transporter permease [Acidobacteriota bacterium]